MTENILLTQTVAAVREAGQRMLTRYSTDSRQSGFAELLANLQANDAAVVDVLQPALTAILPTAGWMNDEHGSGPMPAGDWWLIDPMGGNVNAVHGMPDWNIGVSLVRDGKPILGVIYAPASDEMYAASAGEGATLNGVPLHVSAKTSLDAALAGTGQAQPRRDRELAERIGGSFTAMMQAALYVRISVPVSHQLAQVAAGRMDLHWQLDQVRSHASGILLVQEAGGIVTALDGSPWTIEADGYLAAAPGVHAAALEVLSA